MDMPAKERLEAFLNAFLTPETIPEERRRIALLIGLSTIGIVFLILFGFTAFIQNNPALFAFDMVTATVLAANLMDAKKRKKISTNINIGIALISILYVYLYVTGGVHQTAFMWYFTYPLIACYLLGSIRGGTASILMLLPVVELFVLSPTRPFFAQYSFDFVGRFMGAYLVVCIFSYLFERTREKNREELNAINRSLEDLVEERTAALVTTNAQLREEVEKRKQAHQLMRLSQEILTTVLDSIDATIYVADMDTYEILFMNEHMKKVFGRDMTGEFCWQVFRNQTGPCSHCSNPRLVDAHKNSADVYIWEGQNPITGIWYINYDRAIKWTDSRIVRIQIAFDITERRHAEEKLRESEQRYRLLAENVTDIIWTLNLETMRFDYASPSVKRTRGFTPEEAMELALDKTLSAESLERVTQLLIEELAKEANANEDPNRSLTIEVLQSHKDGSYVWAEATMTFLRNSHGDPVGVLGVTRDISERKKVEHLNQAKIEAEASSRAKSEFLSTMSHELRTPLNHIIGFTELLLFHESGELSEVQREYLDDVHKSSRHLLSLVNDILDLSKVEAGKSSLETSMIVLKDLLEESASMFREKALKHRIALTAIVEDIPERVDADERRLKQIMYNLLSNAVKFTPDGGRIDVIAKPIDRDIFKESGASGRGQAEWIEICVADTGIGLQKKSFECIFNPFEQVDNSLQHKYEGTGLGLALTQKLVELHGGKIWVESEGNARGCAFRFMIPVCQKG